MIDSTPTLKVCTSCNDPFPATTEYFHRQKKSFDGLFAWCKSCKNAYERERKTYPLIQARETARKTSKVYREGRLDYDRARRESDAYLELKQTEYFLELDRIRHQRRNERLRELPNDFTATDWQHALDYFDNKCAVCRRDLLNGGDKVKASRDHWISIRHPDCPGTVKANIVPLCVGRNGCNHSKYEQRPETWLRKRYGEVEAQRVLDRVNAYFVSASSGRGGKIA